MKKYATALTSLLLLAACGSKDNVSTKGDDMLLGSGGQSQIGQPVDPVVKPGPCALVQIACQTLGGLGGTPLPSSLDQNGQRNVDSIPRIATSANSPNLAPTVLDVQKSILSALVVSQGKVFFVRYDLARHAQVDAPVEVGSASSRSSGIYHALGFTQPRLASASPDGKVFAITGKSGLSLRAVNSPSTPLGRANVGGEFAQPRWDGNEIFVDRVSGGHVRQSVISVGAGYSSLGQRAVPSPLDAGMDQLGLRRYGAGSYIWLERNSQRSVLRVWGGQGDSTRNYELPGAGLYGPGFALYRTTGADGPAQAVLNSKKGVHYFTLGANGSVTGDSYPYPEDTQRMIDNPDDTPRIIHDPALASPWQPGAIYSTAGDTQLLMVIPSTFGTHVLMAVDRQFSYRLLGFDGCVNPDFHLVRE